MTTTNSIGRDTIGGAEGGWWERERAAFIIERLDGLGVRPRVTIDLGCGRGSLDPALGAALGGLVIGCDGERHEQWRNQTGRCAFVVADIRRPPFRAGVADLVTAFDVIEHFADDQEPLRALRDLASPDGGRVCVTVPANPSLWSPFDDAVGHFRRYDEPTLVTACAQAGLRPIDRTCFFAWLVPPAWLLRSRHRHAADAVGPGLLDRVVAFGTATLSRAERWLLRRRRLRVGTSMWFCGSVGGDDQRRRRPRPADAGASDGAAGED